MTSAPTNPSPAPDITPYLQTVLDTLSDPVLIQTPDFRILFANKAAQAIIPEINSQDGATCVCYKVLFQFDRPCHEFELQCPMQIALANKEEATVVRQQADSDGQIKWLEIKAQPVLDASGEVVQVVETIHDITSDKKIAAALMQYSHSQEEFFLASRSIATSADLQKLYRHIVSHAKKLLNFDFSTLLLFSDDRSSLVIHDTVGFPQSTINTFMVMDGQGLATYVAKTQQPDAVQDFRTEDRFEVPSIVAEHDIRSALCVPMIIADQVLGVLVGHTRQKRTFTAQETILYANLANQAAMALYTAQTLKELRASEDRYHDLFENSLDLIQMVGPDGRILFANKAWKKALGYGDEEISQLSAFDIIHPDHRDYCQMLFGRLCRGEKVDLLETTFVAKDGRSFPVEGHINANMKNGKLVATRGIFRDVTERKEFEERLKTLSITDELTGLLNRRGFFTLAEKQLAITCRNRSSLYLLYLDLDNMKNINDQYGHKVGDQALQEVAGLLRQTFRDSDIISRMGGDEFTIMLTASYKDEDEQTILKRLDHNLQQLNSKSQPFQIEVSIGIVKYTGSRPCSIEELLSQADRRMYEDKRHKKNHS